MGLAKSHVMNKDIKEKFTSSFYVQLMYIHEGYISRDIFSNSPLCNSHGHVVTGKETQLMLCHSIGNCIWLVMMMMQPTPCVACISCILTHTKEEPQYDKKIAHRRTSKTQWNTLFKRRFMSLTLNVTFIQLGHGVLLLSSLHSCNC